MSVNERWQGAARGSREARATVARRAARGALAGATATGAMSAVMVLATATGRVSRPAPEVITDAALEAVGGAPEGVEKAATVAAHFAFGTVNGALFSLAAPHVPGPAAAKGVLFGIALLTAAYQGWAPKAGILPPLDKQQPYRRMSLVAAHLVYGSVLGWASAKA
jgi:hypothetical protein